MSQLNSVPIIDVIRARAGRAWLYKNDYPRRIDRYVDFFGTAGRDTGTPDPCGELVLERPA